MKTTRDYHTPIRLTKQEREALLADAKRFNLTLSEVIRRRLRLSNTATADEFHKANSLPLNPIT